MTTLSEVPHQTALAAAVDEILCADGLVFLDPAYRVVGINECAIRMFGATDSDLRGKDLSQLISPGGFDLTGRVGGLERMVKDGPLRDLPICIRNSAGQDVPVLLSCAALRGSRTGGFAIVLRDIRGTGDVAALQAAILQAAVQKSEREWRTTF